MKVSHSDRHGSLKVILASVYADAAQASKVVEALDEDKIASEIEALQQKLGELQANIDKVLREVSRHKSH